jgi:hypothetical protein
LLLSLSSSNGLMRVLGFIVGSKPTIMPGRQANIDEAAPLGESGGAV